MARELSLEPDYGRIKAEDLGAYQLPPNMGDEPVVCMEVLGVRALTPIEGSNEVREYGVEVEYRPETLCLDDGSFDEYLQSFQYAKISQESMAKVIREHLCRTLDLDDVFVEVRRPAPADKRVRLGKP